MLGRSDLFASGLALDDVAERVLVAVVEFLRIEMTGHRVDDVRGQVEHLLRGLLVRNVAEILYRLAHLVGVVQEHAKDPLVARLQRDDVLAGRQHHAAERHHALLPDGVADDTECLLTGLAIGDDVVGTVDVEIVDLIAWNELVDADDTGRLNIDRLEVLVGDLDVTVARLLALHDLVGLHHVARLGVDLLHLDAMAGRLVDLVEVDFLGFRSGGVEQDRAGHEGKTQVALPVGAQGHERYSREHRRKSNASGCRPFEVGARGQYHIAATARRAAVCAPVNSGILF